MPKKFVGENSKAAAARDRKNAVKTEERERVAKAKEDALWVEDDKNVLKKLQRKEEQERKKQDALEKKLQNKKAYEDEMETVGNFAKAAPAKVTRAHIDKSLREEQLLREKERKAEEALKKNVVVNDDLHENLNRLDIDTHQARNVDEALEVLSAKSDKPEISLKAAYTAFENRRLPELKIEKPTLRLSQLKQLLKKEWQKSPENPLNAKIMGIIRLKVKMFYAVYSHNAVVTLDETATVGQLIEAVRPAGSQQTLVLPLKGVIQNVDTLLKDLPDVKENQILRVVQDTRIETKIDVVSEKDVADAKQAVAALDDLSIGKLVSHLGKKGFKKEFAKQNPSITSKPALLMMLSDFNMWETGIDADHRLAPYVNIVIKELFPAGVRPQTISHNDLFRAMADTSQLRQSPAIPQPGSSTGGSASQNRAAITNDFFQSAMQSVVGSGQPTSNSASVPQNPPASSTENPNARFAEQLSRFHEIGFTDDRENIEFLTVTNGDVEAALNLLIHSRES